MIRPRRAQVVVEWIPNMHSSVPPQDPRGEGLEKEHHGERFNPSNRITDDWFLGRRLEAQIRDTKPRT